MRGLLFVLGVAAALLAIEAWEIRRRNTQRGRLRRLATGHLIRRCMELHPNDQGGRIPEEWR